MPTKYTKAVLITPRDHQDLSALKIIKEEPYGAVVARVIKFYKDAHTDFEEKNTFVSFE